MKKKKSIIKVTSEGRVYIEIKDFLNQPKVQDTIRKGIEFAKRNKLRDFRDIK